MKKKLILAGLVGITFWMSCSGGNEPKQEVKTDDGKADQELLAQAQGLFQALPTSAENPENPISEEKVKLGHYLYFDTRLSKTGNNSCNSCHNLATYGVDNEPTSKGDNGGRGGRNSPTTLNAALHVAQFWDGRAKDVEEQAGGPVLNPVEMALPSKKVCVDRLKAVKEYQTMFAAAFPNDKDPVTYDNMTKAIGAFERKLITPSRFDSYLKGDLTALNSEEKEGLKSFINAGCTACHTGALLGGDKFMKFGLVNDYHPLTGSSDKDHGKMDLTKQESDKDVFKVPSLRNIAKTAPYFHDGSVAELEKAVKVMGKAQLGKDLTDAEVASIVKFLNALTGEVPAEVQKAPVELASLK